MKFVDNKNYITKQPRIACENKALEHAREVIVNGEWFVCSSLASAVVLSGVEWSVSWSSGQLAAAARAVKVHTK